MYLNNETNEDTIPDLFRLIARKERWMQGEQIEIALKFTAGDFTSRTEPSLTPYFRSENDFS